MIAMMHRSARRAIMGSLTLPLGLRALGWTAAGAMACTVVAMVVSWLV
jgi:hypothetical protein